MSQEAPYENSQVALPQVSVQTCGVVSADHSSKAVSSSVSSGQQVYPPAAAFPSPARPTETFRSPVLPQQMVSVAHSAGQMLAQMSRQSTPSGVSGSNNSPIQAPSGPTAPPGLWNTTRQPFSTQVAGPIGKNQSAPFNMGGFNSASAPSTSSSFGQMGGASASMASTSSYQQINSHSNPSTNGYGDVGQMAAAFGTRPAEGVTGWQQWPSQTHTQASADTQVQNNQTDMFPDVLSMLDQSGSFSNGDFSEMPMFPPFPE